MSSLTSELNWLVGFIENVRLAGVVFTIHAANDVIASACCHGPFQRLDKHFIPADMAITIPATAKIIDFLCVIPSPLNGVDYYWFFSEFHVTSLV
ncbi:hypothetical protein [Citrobacter koseri]